MSIIGIANQKIAAERAKQTEEEERARKYAASCKAEIRKTAKWVKEKLEESNLQFSEANDYRGPGFDVVVRGTTIHISIQYGTHETGDDDRTWTYESLDIDWEVTQGQQKGYYKRGTSRKDDFEKTFGEFLVDYLK